MVRKVAPEPDFDLNWKVHLMVRKVGGVEENMAFEYKVVRALTLTLTLTLSLTLSLIQGFPR